MDIFANNPIIGASYIVPARDKVARPILRRHLRLAIRCSKLPFRAGSDERTA
jgi:hypothetical protein